MNTITIFRKSLSEFFGAFMLVFFGIGSVHTATLFGAQIGLWQIAIVWGLVIAFAVFITGTIAMPPRRPFRIAPGKAFLLVFLRFVMLPAPFCGI